MSLTHLEINAVLQQDINCLPCLLNQSPRMMHVKCTVAETLVQSLTNMLGTALYEQLHCYVLIMSRCMPRSFDLSYLLNGL